MTSERMGEGGGRGESMTREEELQAESPWCTVEGPDELGFQRLVLIFRIAYSAAPVLKQRDGTVEMGLKSLMEMGMKEIRSGENC